VLNTLPIAILFMDFVRLAPSVVAQKYLSPIVIGKLGRTSGAGVTMAIALHLIGICDPLD